MLVKSVRRIQTDWRGHFAFYVNFKCPSYDYQNGFGGRVVPTKGRCDAISASFKKPQDSIEPSAFYDADGAAAIEKAREEKQEELENQQVSLFDRPGVAVEEDLVQVPGEMSRPKPTNIWGDDDDDGPVQPSGSGGAQPVEQNDVRVGDDGTSEEVPNPSLRLDAPITPLHLLEVPCTPTSPRRDSTVKVHENETEEEQTQKRLKVESAKKTRLSMLTKEHSSGVRVVKFADEEYGTMDSYDNDPQMDDHMDYEDPWNDEDHLAGDNVPEALWPDVGPSVHPPSPPAWVDRLADNVELQRVCNMGV